MLINCADVDSYIASVSQNENVSWAEPDYVVQLDYVNNDPDYKYQWGFDGTAEGSSYNISAENAYGVSQSGSNVVAVIDSGVNYNHADLSGNM